MKERILIAMFAFLFTLFLVSFQTYYLTKHEIMKSTFMEVLSKRFNLSEMDSMIKTTCNVTDTLVIPIPGENLSIECSQVNNSTQLIQIVFDHFYFKQYGCGFLECYKSGGYNLFYYLSHQANQTYFKASIGFLAVSLISAALFVAISEDRKKSVGRLGIALLSIGLPLLIISFVVNYFSPFKFAGIEEFALKVDLLVVIIGAFLLLFGKLKF